MMSNQKVSNSGTKYEPTKYYKILRKSPNVPKATNESDIIRTLDNDPNYTFRKLCLIATTFLSENISYKTGRKRKLDETENMTINDSMFEKNPIVLKIESIPEYFHKCSSTAVKVAILLYLAPAIKSNNLKKNTIIKTFNDSERSETVAKFLEKCKCINDPQKEKKSNESKSTLFCTSNVSSLLNALIEITDTHPTKMAFCAKLAKDIKPEGYFSLIQQYFENDWLRLDSIAVFEPLLNEYLKNYTGALRKNKIESQKRDGFTVNPRTIIQEMIDDLLADGIDFSKTQVRTLNAETFKNDKLYDVYVYKGKGSLAPQIELISGHESGHTILQFKSCIFDVLTAPAGMSWSERVKLVKGTYIIVKQMTGEELNNFNETADLAVSWFDETNVYHLKYFTFKKKHNK